MEADVSWKVRSATVMPDHFHVHVVLGHRLTIGQCVARLKAKTKAAIISAGAAQGWERDFFERRIRDTDDILGVFVYIMANPCRAGLCRHGETWPWYYCSPEDWEWFKDFLDADRPPPEWLL